MSTRMDRSLLEAKRVCAARGPSKRIAAVASLLIAGRLILAGAPQEARAQSAEPAAVSATGKGIVGGALLGGEVVIITMAAVGVEKGWPYFVFGGLGAVGGGIGGFFVEDATADTPEVALYMLAGGMALVIPTLVATLNATAYRPPESDTKEPTTNQPAAEPPAPKASVTVTSKALVPTAPKPVARTYVVPRPPGPPIVPHIALSVVDMYRGELALGVPAVELRPVYSTRELAQYGVEQRGELRVPVFKAQF